MALKNGPYTLTHPTDTVCLLLHGLGGGSYEMSLLGESLYSRGLSVEAIHYPGHDQPAERMPASTWPEWFAHASATYQALARTYKQICLVGFSTGCPLALHLAASVPVTKMVLLSPYVSVRYEWFYLLPPEAYLYSIGWLIEDIPRLKLPIFDDALRAAAESVAYFRTFNLSTVRSAIDLIERVKTELPAIRTPTLIIQSRKDSVVDPSGAEYIYQHLGSSDKQLRWLTNSDHIVTLDFERDVVFAEVGAFLADSTR